MARLDAAALRGQRRRVLPGGCALALPIQLPVRASWRLEHIFRDARRLTVAVVVGKGRADFERAEIGRASGNPRSHLAAASHCRRQQNPASAESESSAL